MNDAPDKPPESPMQRALRMKNAAREAQPKARGAGFDAKKAARMPAGASKPWMKR